MLDRLYGGIWTAGIRLRNLAKRLRVLGAIDPLLYRWGPRLVPPRGTEVRVDLGFGMSLRLPPGYPAARSFSAGLYEPDLTKLFESIVQAGMTVIDGGANVGYYTLISARLAGHGGRVFAFEPDQLNFEYLARNLETNGCTNVEAAQLALGAKDGAGRFVRDAHGAEGYLSRTEHDDATVPVEVIALDSFFEKRGWPSVDIVKFDIEGSEPDALRGMFRLSERNPRLQLIMEWNEGAISRIGETYDSVADLLRMLGFTDGYIVEAGYKRFDLAGGLPRTEATYNLHLVKT